MRKTSLEDMTIRKLGLDDDETLTREAINSYQLYKLRETVDYAKENSPYYRRHLKGLSGSTLAGLKDINCFPFTVPDDLRKNSLDFLCVSHSNVARVVTVNTTDGDITGFADTQTPLQLVALNSSGTTSEPKRLYFTEEDLELTVDFFQYGMADLVETGQRVLILMPGDRPGSVGDLLVKGLERMGVEGRVHGQVVNPSETIKEIIDFKADCLVGIPAQLLELIRHSDARNVPPGTVKSILLSTDYVPAAVVREVQKIWYCPVFNHYGMTETGLGGGVECRALSGYHLREADLYFEIIDPETGSPRPDGELGEIAFTTLTRKGMPLIRYRTGDLARFLPEPCPCGTVLKRMEKVRGRLGSTVSLGGGKSLSISDLDEAIFPVPAIMNYRAGVSGRKGNEILDISLHVIPGAERHAVSSVLEALLELKTIREVFGESRLILTGVVNDRSIRPSRGTAKRTISDSREMND
ncbi:coenzyme F390 synthetase-like protein [Desulfofarcimen acetoxidans DSM 771]|uniref:Coenzyme F390 synthetase-like protein n=1 Tax=Desulfofarcimen acetoxidans (strain ATCC 49208 / DSM 771 / KCTC 5769 / VKM B-1644 / 5575) TaxID=485916 RepID=C8W6P8_DESAS|nr:AMP-binding protein [Desulfofarcimen acetoxidans]ACV64157.1 coenzyme F390 synthetase-like protein [Desulfofarcimen acetoxidans DSM 771]